MEKLKKYAKFIAALIGAVVTSFAGLIPDELGQWLTAFAALATAIAVYGIPNKTTEVEDDEYLDEEPVVEDVENAGSDFEG